MQQQGMHARHCAAVRCMGAQRTCTARPWLQAAFQKRGEAGTSFYSAQPSVPDSGCNCVVWMTHGVVEPLVHKTLPRGGAGFRPSGGSRQNVTFSHHFSVCLEGLYRSRRSHQTCISAAGLPLEPLLTPCNPAM